MSMLYPDPINGNGQALAGLTRSVYVDAYGANPTGVTDSTTAFQDALLALPTVTIYANPTTQTGASVMYHQGTILLGSGTYKLGTKGDIGNLGPFVSIIGPGHGCCKLDYRGSGDCLRLYNAIIPASGNFDNLGAWAGTLSGFTIDGTNASAGANGLHYGDTEGGILGPDLYISNFPGTGSVGLLMDNTVTWTENIWGRVVFNNCKTAVYFNVSTVSANNSFEYNDLLFKVYALANQNGIVLDNGAFYANGSLRMLGNFANSNSALSNAALTIKGQVSGGGQWTQITECRLDIQVETDISGSNHPQTINFGSVSNNAIYNCVGVLSFSGTWTASNWSDSASFSAANFTFMGQVAGDTNIAPTIHGSFGAIGGIVYGLTQAYANGGVVMAAGDFFPLTLSQNMTVAFSTNTAGPQRKTFIFKQAASGGPYTVTWPKPGSPSVGSPAVYWAGGTAPTMSAGASAIDVYELRTSDGIHWYGQAIQNLS